MAKITPSRGYCLIEPLEADEVSAGGVYMPERAKDMPNKGKVLAIGGPTFEMIEYASKPQIDPYSLIDCKVGDTVIFKRFVDQRIKENGKELLFVPFQDIIGIYEED